MNCLRHQRSVINAAAQHVKRWFLGEVVVGLPEHL